MREYLEPEKTVRPYTHRIPTDRLERLSFETWKLDQHLMERPRNEEMRDRFLYSRLPSTRSAIDTVWLRIPVNSNSAAPVSLTAALLIQPVPGSANSFRYGNREKDKENPA